MAVAWSDLFQGTLMFFGLVALPVVAIIVADFPGGIFPALGNIDPDLLNIWGPGGFNMVNVATAFGLATIGLGFLGSPQVYVRFIAIRNEEELEKERRCLLYTLLTDSAAVFIGILGRVLFTGIGDNPENILGISAENVLPILVETVLPMALVGLYIGVVLAAVMSTIDSLLVVASSAVTRDFYQQIFHPDMDGEKLTTLSRNVTLVMALIALAIAMIVSVISPDRTIFWFVIFGWSGIAATFCPTIILSLFWKDFTENGAMAAMIAGFITVPVTKFILATNDTFGIYFEKMDVMAPSFAIGLIAGYIASKVDNK